MRTFSSTAELDCDLLIHVLAQVKDVLFLWSLGLSTSTSSLCAPTAAASAAAVASSTSASTPECASLRHGISVERKRRDLDVEACGDVQLPRPVRVSGLYRSGKGCFLQGSHPTSGSRAVALAAGVAGVESSFPPLLPDLRRTVALGS